MPLDNTAKRPTFNMPDSRNLSTDLPARVKSIASLIPTTASVGVVLGSGLGGFGEELLNRSRIHTRNLPGYPASTVSGHAGQIITGKIGGLTVLAFQGRIHMYEGYRAEEVVIPIHVAHQLGVRNLILTCAVGSFTRRCEPGDLVLIDDHINMTFRNPLRVMRHESGGRPQPTHVYYDRGWLDRAEQVALDLQIRVKRGTLACVTGPCYETPAETRMLARLGADVGGMSTVPEALCAASLGMRVLGVACVTNFAAGLADKPLNHTEVIAMAAETSKHFVRLLRGVIETLDI